MPTQGHRQTTQGQAQEPEPKPKQTGKRKRPLSDPYIQPPLPAPPGKSPDNLSPWDSDEEDYPDDTPSLPFHEVTSDIPYRPAPRLVFVKLGEGYRCHLQTSSLRGGFDRQKLALLRLIGNHILQKCKNSDPYNVRVSVTDIAREAVKQFNGSENTWKSRISKLIDREWVEFPDGKRRPLREFFHTRTGRRTQLKQDILRILADSVDTSVDNIPTQYMRAIGMIPNHTNYRKIRNRISRLVCSMRDLPDNDEAIRKWLEQKGFDTTDDNVKHVRRFLQKGSGRRRPRRKWR